MFGPMEFVVWVVLSLVIAAALCYAFYRFTGRGRKGEVARREGVRHEGVQLD